MAFAKGRAFVILNRMAEQNPEAKKLLNNLNSISQEDFDAQFGKLLGKGGSSAGDEPKTAPKSEKGAKEGKVVANKDFDPNKEGVQSIFGTEEENAKSKEKKVYDTPEQVMGKERKNPFNEEPYNKEIERLKQSGQPTDLEDAEELGKFKDYMKSKGSADNPMTSAKEGIKPLDTGNDDLYDFVSKNEKENPALSSYLAEFETYADDDTFTLEGFADYLDSQSENEEDTPEKNAEVKEVKAFVDKKLGRDTKVAPAPTQDTQAFGTSKEMGGGIGGGARDLLGKKADLADPNRPDIQAEMEQEMEDQLSGTGTDYEDEEGLAQAFEVVKARYKNDPQRLAALEKMQDASPSAAKGSASNPMTSPLEGIKPVEGENEFKPTKDTGVGFTKNFLANLGEALNKPGEIDTEQSLQQKNAIYKEASALIDKYKFSDPDDGGNPDTDLDYLTSIYLPYIALAYANYKRSPEGREGVYAPNKVNTLEDFIKTRNATDINKFLKMGKNKSLQKDDISYVKRTIETMRNTMKTKK